MYSLIRQIDSGKFLRVGKMANIKSLAFVDNIVSTSINLWITKNHPQQGIDFFNYVDVPDLCSRLIVENVYRELNRKKPVFSLPLWLARLLVFPVDLLIKITGKNLPISSARINKLAVANTQIDASKIHKIADPPATSVPDGIQQMVSWYQTEGKTCSVPNRRPPSNFQASSNA
jgi:GlcNAc-P-P-Und epimerase